MADSQIGASRLVSRHLTRRRVLMGLAGSGAALTIRGPVESRASVRTSTLAAATISTARVDANPHNVLSAVVTVESPGAQRLKVDYGVGGAFTETTPTFAVRGPRAVVPVLGLRPETKYALRVVATGADGQTATSAPLSFQTGAVPTWVPRFEVKASGALPAGYTLISPTSLPSGWYEPSTVVIVDGAGEVVWYRAAASMVFDFQPQPNGHFTAAISAPSTGAVGAGTFEEWDILGNTVASWSVQGHDFTDWHDMRLAKDGSEALMLGYTTGRRDARAVGGPANALIWSTVVQRLKRNGQVLFEWSALDHFKVEEANDLVWRDENGPRTGYDWTHANAIEVDHDGHYLLSTRYFNEVTKIDSRTGDAIWRMGGGRGNQFTFIDDPHNGFAMQHAPKRLANGHLIVLDNSGASLPLRSRAAEYEVDEERKTARLVWSYEPGTFNPALGNAQRLANGNTLVDLGRDYRVVEVTPAGEVVWELSAPSRGWGLAAWREGMPGRGEGLFGIYRSFRIRSLYDWG